MKQYFIYQFHLEGEPKQKNLLVGFATAKNSREAKTNYLEQHYPNDLKKAEQIRGYLAAWECKPENYENPELLNTIEQNKIKLGTWA